MIRHFPASATLAAAAILAVTAPALSRPARAQTPATPAARPTSRVPLPLEAARHLRYTATKGSWMSVDVSPDGQRIVLDLLGDLYTIPMAGGSASRLTSGMAHDAQPRWSPDGKRVRSSAIAAAATTCG